MTSKQRRFLFIGVGLVVLSGATALVLNAFQDSVKAAQQMTQSDRSAMINQMVERRATRLNEDGSNLTDWLKLVRAYTVLGRKDDALKALTSARKNFAGNTEALGRIDELARSLGLSS
jgi:cytochrome c-type biogenesis protein CcmH